MEEQSQFTMVITMGFPGLGPDWRVAVFGPADTPVICLPSCVAGGNWNRSPPYAGLGWRCHLFCVQKGEQIA